ncbi:MAG: hypothetical protein WCF18_17990 [Chthoniobacteraceae bacterium]
MLVRYRFTIVRPLLCLGLSTLSLAPCAVQGQFLFDATKAEMAGNADWVIDANTRNIEVNSASDGSGRTGTGGNESNPQRLPSPAASGITAGTAETYWDGALSAWAVALVQRGHTVESLPYNGAITFGNAGNAQDLSRYKVFVLAEPNILFTAAEKTAILNFVSAGGGLFLIGDHGAADRNNDGSDAVEVWNDLMTNNSVKANPFGISFNGDTVTPNAVVATSSTDPITHGSIGIVTDYAYADGSTMTINTTQNSTVKAAVWSSTLGSTRGVMVAYGNFGAGRFVAVGDSSPFDDGTGDPKDMLFAGWTDGGNFTAGFANDGRLAMNASVWLAVPEPTIVTLLACGALTCLSRRRCR